MCILFNLISSYLYTSFIEEWNARGESYIAKNMDEVGSLSIIIKYRFANKAFVFICKLCSWTGNETLAGKLQK